MKVEVVRQTLYHITITDDEVRQAIEDPTDLLAALSAMINGQERRAVPKSRIAKRGAGRRGVARASTKKHSKLSLFQETCPCGITYKRRKNYEKHMIKAHASDARPAGD